MLNDTVAEVTGDAPTVGLGSVHGLTTREIDVVGLIAEGLSNKLIADRLDITPHTVKFHVGNVIKKLRSSNRAGAAIIAHKMGLIR